MKWSSIYWFGKKLCSVRGTNWDWIKMKKRGQREGLVLKGKNQTIIEVNQRWKNRPFVKHRSVVERFHYMNTSFHEEDDDLLTVQHLSRSSHYYSGSRAIKTAHHLSSSSQRYAHHKLWEANCTPNRAGISISNLLLNKHKFILNTSKDFPSSFIIHHSSSSRKS